MTTATIIIFIIVINMNTKSINIHHALWPSTSSWSSRLPFRLCSSGRYDFVTLQTALLPLLDFQVDRVLGQPRLRCHPLNNRNATEQESIQLSPDARCRLKAMTCCEPEENVDTLVRHGIGGKVSSTPWFVLLCGQKSKAPFVSKIQNGEWWRGSMGPGDDSI